MAPKRRVPGGPSRRPQITDMNSNLIQRITSVFEKNSNNEHIDNIKLEMLEKQREEHEFNRSLYIASSPEIREVTNKIEENCNKIQKLITENQILWDARNSYIQEKSEEFEKANEFPNGEYTILKKRQIERQVERQNDMLKKSYPLPPKYFNDSDIRMSGTKDKYTL